jgi:hypothetical protein
MTSIEVTAISLIVKLQNLTQNLKLQQPTTNGLPRKQKRIVKTEIFIKLYQNSNLNVGTVWMIALSTLDTGNEFAFFAESVTAARQTHVLFQSKMISRRTQHYRLLMVIVLAILILTAATLCIQ